MARRADALKGDEVVRAERVRRLPRARITTEGQQHYCLWPSSMLATQHTVRSGAADGAGNRESAAEMAAAGCCTGRLTFGGAGGPASRRKIPAADMPAAQPTGDCC